MEDWQFRPARDLNLRGMERYRSHQRESGLVPSSLRLIWWTLLRATLRGWNSLEIHGRENLPTDPSFVVVANHTSHLDAPLLTTVLPMRFRDRTFPLAAQDVFFERLPLAAFSAVFVNAMPVVRGSSGRRSLLAVRERLLSEPTVIILFPEGTRTRSRTMVRFKPGVGILVAGNPVPVLPCYIAGAAEALPVGARSLKRKPVSITVGKALTFENLKNTREGWGACAERLSEAVCGLGPHLDDAQ